MATNFLLLYCILCFVNVVVQTIKSLCTIKSSTFISACVNAMAYGLYTYVIFFTNAEGIPLWGKALITAAANFSGVYLANFMFSKLFSHEAEWAVNASVHLTDVDNFITSLDDANLVYHYYGNNSDGEYAMFTIFCPTSKESEKLRRILPMDAKYHINESIKKL